MSAKQETIRTPLGRARGLGSAKDGVHHWWMQRVSAVGLIPTAAFLFLNIHKLMEPDYSKLAAFISKPHVSVALALFVVFGFYHAALGVQVIIEDYVHNEACKIALLLLNKLVFFALGFTCLFAILTIGISFAGLTFTGEN